MTSSAVRVAILVAAVVLGAVIISKGFPTFDQAIAVPSRSPTPSPTGPSPSTSQTTPSATTPSPRQQGVKVAVYNATSAQGLAAVVAGKLQNKGGYVIPVIDNFPASQITLIYYRDAQGKADANLLKDKFLKDGHVTRLPPGTPVPKTVELAVVLGSDYAAGHPIG